MRHGRNALVTRESRSVVTLNLKKYALHYLLALVGVICATLGLAVFDMTFPSATGALIPPMVAALLAGTKHAETTMQPLAKGEAWRLALPMTLCAVAIHLVLGVIYFGMTGLLSDGLPMLLKTISLATWILLAAFVFGLIYLTNRIFLGLGVRNGLKVAQRKANKS